MKIQFVFAPMKTRGSMLRAKLILRQKEFGFKDIPWLLKKGFQILANELKSVSGNKKREK